MITAATALAIASLTTSVASAGVSYKQGSDTNKQQEKIQRTEEVVANEQASRDRKKQVMAAMQVQAGIQNTAAGTNTTGSSMQAYGMGQAGQQAGTNIGTINTNQAYGSVLADQQQELYNIQTPSAGQSMLNLGAQYSNQYLGSYAQTAGAKAGGGL